ncbi:hypothetical protein NQD34_014817 [Periophthalmus magnuspinnatus]|nr:hypothetical protein NQD34_014817 [Periophthalmus magnuspinnatus]
MLGLHTMEVFTTWMFCLIVVAAHWANAGYVGFEGLPRPNFPKPGILLQRKSWPPAPASDQPQMKLPGPVAVPPPFNHVKTQNRLFYPVYKPWRVPTNTQTQLGSSQILPQAKPAQLPSRPHGQFPAYWVQIPSYRLNVDQPKRPVDPIAIKQPNYLLQKIPMRPLSKPTVLPYNKRPAPLPANVFVQPPLKNQVGGFDNYAKVQVPKLPQNSNSQGLGSPLFDFPDNPQFAPRYVPRYPHMFQNYPPPPEEQDGSMTGPHLFQRRKQPLFEWSREERQWVPKFS